MILVYNFYLSYQYQQKRKNSMKKSLTTSLSPPPTSMAYKFGISTKQNNPLGSMGMNPNLNIEDEYIENLLKQIHFMNMEIKLIKEKQSQSDGNALWGIVNRTNMPMVNNIVQSSQKYQVMKREADGNLHRLEKDIASLDNHQGALINEIKFLDKKKEEIAQKSKKWEDECKLKHEMLDERIKNSSTKLKNLKQQLQKQRKKNKELNEENAKAINEDKIDRSKREKQNLQIKNDQIIQEAVLNEIVGQISIIQVLTSGLVKKFEENPEYIKAKEDEEVLRSQVTKLERDILGANFQLIQLGESIKMAEMEKDKQIKERKLLTEEYEQKKGMFAQILFMNSVRKQKQIQNRKSVSQDIAKADQQTSKLERALEQTKKKLLKNQQTNVLTSNQIQTYQSEIQHLKQTHKSLKQQISKQKQINQQQQIQLVNIGNDLLITTDQYEKSLNIQTNVSLELFQLERELQYLRERRQLLVRNIQLKDVIDGLKIQELEKVVQKNKDLNSTVATLMGKWDQVKMFSRA